MKFPGNKLFADKLNYKAFLVYCLILLVLSFLVNKTLLTREFYFKSFENVQREIIEQIIDINQKWGWLSYFLIPIKLVIKFCIVGLVLKIGFIFIKVDIKYINLLNVAIVSEAIYVIYSAIVTISALGLKSIEELHTIPAISLCSVFSINKVPTYLGYLCRNLSLIEILYWLVLAYGLTIITHRKYLSMLKFVLSTYVPILLFWLLLVSYITLTSL